MGRRAKQQQMRWIRRPRHRLARRLGLDHQLDSARIGRNGVHVYQASSENSGEVPLHTHLRFERTRVRLDLQGELPAANDLASTTTVAMTPIGCTAMSARQCLFNVQLPWRDARGILKRLAMIRHLLVAIALLAVAAVRQASAEAQKTVEPLPPPLRFDRLGSADGLPNNDVRAIVQDRRGFLWFGTQEGLVRYDGTSVRVYRPRENDPTSISAGYVTALAVDPTGKLWVGTPESGVDLYDPDTDRFTRFTHGDKSGLTSEGVTAIARDGRDRIWFAMSVGGLNRFDPATRTFTEYSSGPLETAITAIDIDKAGNLWLGTASDGAIRWNPDDGSTATYRPTPPDGGPSTAPITALLASSSGKVWIGTEGDGLFAFDTASRKFTRYRHLTNDPGTISDDHISALFEDRHHTLWIGTVHGLNRMDVSGHIVQYHHDPNDLTTLAASGVESLYQDEGGVIWVGLFTNGVCKFDELRMKFGHYRTRSNPATAYYEDPDALWVGTYDGGIYKYEFEAQRQTVYRSLGTDSAISLDGWITALLRDHRGILWVSVKGKGLIAFDPKTEARREYLPDPKKPNGLPVDTIWDIWEDDRGSLWLASWGGGLVRLDLQSDQFTAFTADQSTGLSSNYLYNLYPDPVDKKVLWVGTAKGGLVRFDITTNTGTSFRHRAEDPTSLGSDDVLSIHRARGGAVWAGTYGGGLNRLDPATGKVQRFTSANSRLPNDVVFGVLPDDDGKLWLSTNGAGLVQFDPRSAEVVVYHASDGLQDDEFAQASFRRMKSGKLLFGGLGGFTSSVRSGPCPRSICRTPTRSSCSLRRCRSRRRRATTMPTSSRASTTSSSRPIGRLRRTPSSTAATTCCGSAPPTGTACGTRPASLSSCPWRRRCGEPGRRSASTSSSWPARSTCCSGCSSRRSGGSSARGAWPWSSATWRSAARCRAASSPSTTRSTASTSTCSGSIALPTRAAATGGGTS
ncbi:MAG: hypothetical protein E6J90_06015 [Deltaproteobacteria bacterium]|nr:MAG: hypothetical protein E6J90_06015 [Deltaproteobacteria bacterium]